MQAEIQFSPTDPLILPLVPHEKRQQVALLWRLEARLEELCRAGKEPALRQIRLAWWRDALAALDDADARVPDEPLLRDVTANLLPTLSGTRLAEHAEAKAGAMVAEWANADVMAAGRSLFALTAALVSPSGDDAGGAPYALLTTALALDNGTDRQRLIAAAAACQPVAAQPRALAVLDRLARMIAKRGGRRSRPREQALILRVGLFGR